MLIVSVSPNQPQRFESIEVYTEDAVTHGAGLARGDRVLIALLSGGDYSVRLPSFEGAGTH